MSDGFDRVVASQKQSASFNPIKITQKNAIFSYFIKLQEHWGNFQVSYEPKKSMQNIMRLMLEEVIMSDGHISDGQLYSFLQLFVNTVKTSLN